MGRCETCGNESGRTFDVILNGNTHTFDCFECAIMILAPVCSRCGILIIGHGHQDDVSVFCGPHCAREAERSREANEASPVAGHEPVPTPQA